MAELRVVTEPLGGSPLSIMIQRGQAPAAWAGRRPDGVEAWRGALLEAAAGKGGWLGRLAPAFGPAGVATDRLERTARGGGAVITTGQQPGLFGGPIYTWTKALSALALADHLEAITGIPVCPVFWAATDDADFEEARSTIVPAQGRFLRLRLSDAPAAGTPMASAALGDVSALLEALEDASGSASDSRPLRAAREAYGRAGATVGSAYLSLLRTILGPLGIPVLDASHEAVRTASLPLLERALAESGVIRDALARRDAEILAAAFEPQVVSDLTRSLVFGMERGTKTRLPVGAPPPAADAWLGPNVVLRPVVEGSILPTAAYVAGPAELAYFAQVTAVADALGESHPTAVPRWSATVVEPHVSRILDRLELEIAELRDLPGLERRFAGALAPPSGVELLHRWMRGVDEAAGALAEDSTSTAVLPPTTIEGARQAMQARIARLERRLLAGVKRQQAELFTSLRTASAAVYPDGKRQERVANFLPMLARQGAPLMDAMYAAAHAHAEKLVGTGSAAAAARLHSPL
jgi:bacillithiol synthase